MHATDSVLPKHIIKTTKGQDIQPVTEFAIKIINNTLQKKFIDPRFTTIYHPYVSIYNTQITRMKKKKKNNVTSDQGKIRHHNQTLKCHKC